MAMTTSGESSSPLRGAFPSAKAKKKPKKHMRSGGTVSPLRSRGGYKC